MTDEQKIKLMRLKLYEKLNPTYTDPQQYQAELYKDISSINYTAIIANKLATLATAESTIEISDKYNNAKADYMRNATEALAQEHQEISSIALGEGECLVIPAITDGEIKPSVVHYDGFVVTKWSGKEPLGISAVIDSVRLNNGTYNVLICNQLHDRVNQTTTIEYIAYHSYKPSIFIKGAEATQIEMPLDWYNQVVTKASDLEGLSTTYSNVNGLLCGYYRSPQIARRGEKRGVPVTYSCVATISKIIELDKQLQTEFRNAESVIFTDPRNIQTDEKGNFKINGNIIPLQSRAGQSGNNIDIYNPTLRVANYLERKTDLLKELEQQCLTNSGILTPLSTGSSTATEIKLATTETLAFIKSIHSMLEFGDTRYIDTISTLYDVMGKPYGDFEYSIEFINPFDVTDEQGKAILQGVEIGAYDAEDYRRYYSNTESVEDRQNALERIKESKEQAVNNEINRLLNLGT